MKNCHDVREWIQDRLDRDEDPCAPAADSEIEAHRAHCEDCVDYARTLESIRSTLRTLPAVRMPEADFETVLDRTVRAYGAEIASETASRFGRKVPAKWRPTAWWAVAAAALIAVAALIALPRNAGAPNGTAVADTYTAEQVDNASEQLRLALGLSGQALRTSREAAAEDVRELDRTLNGLPIRLPLTRRRNSDTRGEL